VVADLAVAAGLDVHADVELRERFDELVADMQQLPERQRGALAMRELAGLDYGEIATALEISPASAKQAIYDARRALHELARGRELACDVIHRALANGDGRSLRGRAVRAHLRACEECRELREATAQRRSHLAALAPAMPAATVKRVVGALGLAGGGGAAAESGLLAAGLPVALKALTAVLAGAGVTGAVAAGGSPAGVDPPALRAAAQDRPADKRTRRAAEQPRGRTAARRATERRAGAGPERSSRTPAATPDTKRFTRQSATVAGPTPGADRAPQPPAPAPAAEAPPQRPTPVRDVVGPREDPGQIRTSVRVVGTTTATTVNNVRDSVSEAVPALPKRKPRP
jgi:hypothetical protein